MNWFRIHIPESSPANINSGPLSQKIGTCTHFGGNFEWACVDSRRYGWTLKQASLEKGTGGPSGRIGVKGRRWGKGIERLGGRGGSTDFL